MRGDAAESVLRQSRLGGVLCVTLDNPPLNIIDSRAYTALYDAFGAAEADDQVVGVVLAAAGRLFSAGGNINELGQPIPPGAADVTAVIDRIATFGKPIGIALHGKAIGASVIMALACDVRVGHPDTMLILPEVNLGLIPRCGATQRLLRLAGIPVTLDMIALGKPLDAATAHASGLLDEIVDPSLDRVAVAADRIRHVATGAQPRRPLVARPVPALTEGQTAEDVFAACRLRAEELYPGRAAPLAAIDLVRSILNSNFVGSAALEQQEYERLLWSDEARALRERLVRRDATKGRAKDHD